MNVAIAWYGAEGQGSYNYYTQRGDDVTIVTPKFSHAYPAPAGAKTITGPDAFYHLTDFDLVLRSAGTRPDSLHTNGKIWSQTNEFIAQCAAPIIGVTGTKGKGTTSSLIAAILRASGKRVHLVGNIGLPPLDVLNDVSPDDVVVFELSSFQLWDLKKSPSVAVVLMIEPDHLDVHTNMEEYVQAKANIARHQTKDDIIIYHPTNQYAKKIAEQSPGQQRRYGVPDDGQVYAKDGGFYVEDTLVCDVSALTIPGKYNIDNACAAVSACLPFLQNTDYVQAGLQSFTGLPHRLKLVGEIDGVRYYDDSIATTPGAAIAVLQSFAEPKILILGGSDKGADYNDIVAECKKTGTQVVSVGETGKRIAALCGQQGVPVTRIDGRMPAVVKACRQLAQPGSVVLLCPASASFDQYNSYSDRGDQFAAAVGDVSCNQNKAI